MLNNSISFGRGNGDRLSPDVSNSSNESPLRNAQCKAMNISFRNQSNTFQEPQKHNEARPSWQQQSNQHLCDSYEQSTNLSPHSYNSSPGRQLLLPSSLQTNSLEQTNSNNVLHGSETEIDKQVPSNVHQLCVSLENQKANSSNSTRSINEQIASHLINYTSANVISPSASFYRGNSVAPSYLSITQFHYQNIPPESSVHYSPSLPIGYASLPPPSALTQSLLFEPPPRDGRSYQNLGQSNYQPQDDILSLESSPPVTCHTDQTCQKRSSETCIRCSVSYDQRKLNHLSSSQGNNIKETCQHKNGLNQILTNPNVSSITNTNIESMINNTSNNILENKLNSDGCMHSDRTNLKLKLCKNVVNVPKQMENIIHIDCAESPIYDCEKSHSKQTLNENVLIVNGELNCEKLQANKSNNDMNMFQVDEAFSRYDAVSDREFIDVIIEGLNTGEEIATKYQNIPCFKNIKRLCEKTKNIVMTPHCTHRNIHSQGVPWATKDYIFVFTRLTSIWYLLKGYLGQKSEVFNKIEKLYSPKLRTSFEVWEKASIQLSLDILETFIALGNNSRGKWSPKAHSTPVYNPEKCFKNSVPFIIFPSNRIGEEDAEDIALNRQCIKNDKEFKSDPRYCNKTNIQPSNTPLISKNTLNMKENSKNRMLKLPPYVNEIDSGDEDSTKKYIKPGSYTVPELKNMVSIIKPRPDISNMPIPNQQDNSYKTPTQNQCGVSKQPIFKNIHISNELKMNNTNEPVKISKYANRIENDFVPFKNTPQGKMHSALLKLNSVDVPDTPKYPTSEYKNFSVNGKKDNSFSSADSEDAVSFQSVFLLNYIPDKIDVSTQFSVDENSNYDSDILLQDASEIVKREYPAVISSSNNQNHRESEKYSSKSSSLISSAVSSSSSDNLSEFNKYNSNHPERNVYKSHQPLTRSKSGNNKALQTRKEYRNRESKLDLRVDTNNAKQFSNVSNMQHKRPNAKLFNSMTCSKSSHAVDKKCSQRKEIDTLNISSWYNKYRGCLTRNVSEKFKNIVNTLYKMSNSNYFYFEVDTSHIPDYYQIVKSPIFIVNVQHKLDDCKYKDMHEVVDDIRKVFNNAQTFFSVHPNKDLEDITEHFSSVFEKLLLETFPSVDFSPH